MDNWTLYWIVTDAATDNAAGWKALGIVHALLDGDLSRDEAEAMLTGLVNEPAKLLDTVIETI